MKVINKIADVITVSMVYLVHFCIIVGMVVCDRFSPYTPRNFLEGISIFLIVCGYIMFCWYVLYRTTRNIITKAIFGALTVIIFVVSSLVLYTIFGSSEASWFITIMFFLYIFGIIIPGLLCITKFINGDDIDVENDYV